MRYSSFSYVGQVVRVLQEVATDTYTLNCFEPGGLLVHPRVSIHVQGEAVWAAGVSDLALQIALGLDVADDATIHLGDDLPTVWHTDRAFGIADALPKDHPWSLTQILMSILRSAATRRMCSMLARVPRIASLLISYSMQR